MLIGLFSVELQSLEANALRSAPGRCDADLPDMDSLMLEFEGVYMNADVWLNGVHLGNHPYGYTAFEFDISDLVHKGENVLAVQVKNEGRNSRWYSGSGIYRHVWLKISGSVHVKTWGVFITTPEISEELATVGISTQIEDGREEKTELQITTQIFDAAGNEVAITKSEILAENSLSQKQLFRIESPNLWSPDLYVH